MSRGGGAIHSQILPGKPHHNRILCLLAPLSSVLQHHKTAIVNRRFNHNHRPPVRQTIANFNSYQSLPNSDVLLIPMPEFDKYNYQYLDMESY